MFIMELKTFAAFTALLGLAAGHPGYALASGSYQRRERMIVERQIDASDPYTNWPSYSQLPLHSDYPTAAAWGVWGADDVNAASAAMIERYLVCIFARVGDFSREKK